MKGLSHLLCAEEDAVEGAMAASHDGHSSLSNSPCTESHRVADMGTSGDDLVQPPPQTTVMKSGLPRAMSSWALNISKDGDSITSLGN
ncbi:ankyrin repeat and death domain-containing protein 1B [Grus japonensis]|uniref:Ankyrin repeat and death domain-containing protein 1B n=1 Tax=Grus japonensis TaxID=30415 RepID=A0ABC9Y1R9_GRUJA